MPTAGQGIVDRGIIDTHHHIVPPPRLAELRKRGMRDGPSVGWTLDETWKMMESGGLSSVVVSIPNATLNDPVIGPDLTRACNEYSAQLVVDHPGRFGLFASLPMPDIDASLREIEYAGDTLKVDGFVATTSYQDKYLGDPAFAPVLDELNRRGAILFVHPVTPPACRGIQPEISEAMIEFGTDTTRAIASLLFRGAAQRCPDIKFIFSHGGGTLTSLLARFCNFYEGIKPSGPDAKVLGYLPDGPEAALRKFYYDIALANHPVSMRAIIDLVGSTQILFGTDYPWRTAESHSEVLGKLGLSASELDGICRGNAKRLLPRFRD